MMLNGMGEATSFEQKLQNIFVEGMLSISNNSDSLCVPQMDSKKVVQGYNLIVVIEDLDLIRISL